MSFTRRLTGDVGTTEVLAEAQAQILAAQGWSHGQGRLFGRPQPEPFMG